MMEPELVAQMCANLVDRLIKAEQDQDWEQVTDVAAVLAYNYFSLMQEFAEEKDEEEEKPSYDEMNKTWAAQVCQRNDEITALKAEIENLEEVIEQLTNQRIAELKNIQERNKEISELKQKLEESQEESSEVKDERDWYTLKLEEARRKLEDGSMKPKVRYFSCADGGGKQYTVNGVEVLRAYGDYNYAPTAILRYMSDQDLIEFEVE